MTFNVRGIEIKIGFLFAAVISVLLCFRINNIVQISVFSAILHEMGHIISLIISGDYPQKITFGIFGLSVVRRNDVRLNYKSEIIAAFCGPMVNVLIILLFLPLLYLKKSEFILNIISVNLALAVFNLLPVFGLDGGRILEFILLRKMSVNKAEIIIRVVSLAVIIPIMAAGFYVLIKSRYNFTLLLLSVYLSVLLYMRCK